MQNIYIISRDNKMQKDSLNAILLILSRYSFIAMNDLFLQKRSNT